MTPAKIAYELLVESKAARAWANALLSGLPVGADAVADQAHSMLQRLQMPPLSLGLDALLWRCFQKAAQTNASKLNGSGGIGSHMYITGPLAAP